MGFQCVPQVMGLVRSDGMRRDGKGQAKHRANVGAIIGEAFLIADPKDGHAIPFRKSASETYDRTLTKDNKYTGYSTADDVLAAIEREAEAQTVEVRTKDKETEETVIRQRPLRSDAVIATAVIFNPPGAVSCHWTPEQNAKFFQDSLDVMAQIQCSIRVDNKGSRRTDQKRSQQECHLFRRENIIAIAEHRDEGEPDESEDVRTPNWHVVYKPEGEDGKYKGNLIDPYFLSHLSKEYPRLMRERGWDIDDCETTDWQRFNDGTTPENAEYRAKRKSKIREGGKSVNKYRERAARKKEKANLEEAQEILARTIGTKRDAEEYAERMRLDAEAEAERIIAAARKEKAGIEADIAILAAERDQAVRDRDKAKEEQRDAEQARNDAAQKAATARMRLDMMGNTEVALRGDIDRLKDARAKADREYRSDMQAVETAKNERAKAEAERDLFRKEAEAARRDRDAIRGEIRAADEEAEAAKRNRDAFREKARAAGQEADKVKQERDAARADRDAAREEAAELAEQKAALDARQADLDEQYQRLQLREEGIRFKTDFLQRERERQEAELKERAAELDQREHAVESKETALEATAQHQARTKQEQEAMAQDLTRREGTVRKAVAKFKGQRNRVKAWMNDTYAQRMGEVGTLARRVRRLTLDRSVATELAEIEQVALNPSPLFPGERDGGPER